MEEKFPLRSFVNYSDIRVYTVGSGVDELRLSDEEDAVGTFSRIGDDTLCLYRKDGAIYLVVNACEYRLDELEVKLKSKFLKRELLLLKDGMELFRSNYKVDFSLKRFVEDFLAYNDYGFSAESCDYGLFIFNIANDKARQQVFINPDGPV